MRGPGCPGEQRGRNTAAAHRIDRRPALARSLGSESLRRSRFNDASRWQEIRDEMVKTLPFKRSGRPDEVADLAVFLASARASYISGIVVTIDAGQSMRPR